MIHCTTQSLFTVNQWLYNFYALVYDFEFYNYEVADDRLALATAKKYLNGIKATITE